MTITTAIKSGGYSVYIFHQQNSQPGCSFLYKNLLGDGSNHIFPFCSPCYNITHDEFSNYHRNLLRLCCRPLWGSRAYLLGFSTNKNYGLGPEVWLQTTLQEHTAASICTGSPCKAPGSSMELTPGTAPSRCWCRIEAIIPLL